ncbi:Putative cleavage and polyadenylation specificity factor subunit 4-like protein [Cricetulus griseus]|uniref:Cleavage and polyadenylation specificity factor subunit 4 n=1 Tax=Cricetulus griseus TaxID=10029 RepID=G3GTI3_CRIGR|nr:Putative cleavage and polyadenylation specificity factor subunit 4-like protein [Cricetulus griseus]
MEEVIAALEGVTFAFEQDVELQKGTGLLPFQGMDKSNSAVCNFFAKGLCEKGTLCPLRHEKGEKIVVCKHWLRGLCRKGDCCNFLHQYDIDRMPVCYFHSKFVGPLCKYHHVHQVMCLNYFTGFCPKGPKCQFGHPKMSQVLHPSNVKVSAELRVPQRVPIFWLPHLSVFPSTVLFSRDPTLSSPNPVEGTCPASWASEHRVAPPSLPALHHLGTG